MSKTSTKNILKSHESLAITALKNVSTITVNDWTPEIGYQSFSECYGKVLTPEIVSEYFLKADQVRKMIKNGPKGKTIFKFQFGNVTFILQKGGDGEIALGALTANRLSGYMARFVFDQMDRNSTENWGTVINKISARAGIEKNFDDKTDKLVYWSLAPGAYMFYDTFGIYPYAHEAMKRASPISYNMPSGDDSYIGLHNAAKMKAEINGVLQTINDFLSSDEGIREFETAFVQIKERLGKASVGMGITQAVYKERVMSLVKDLMKK